MSEIPNGLLGKAYAATFLAIVANVLTLVAAVILAAPLWIILCIAAPIILWSGFVLVCVCREQPTCGPG